MYITYFLKAWVKTTHNPYPGTFINIWTVAKVVWVAEVQHPGINAENNIYQFEWFFS